MNKESISIIEAGYEVIKELENKIEDLENEIENLDLEVQIYQERIKDLEERRIKRTNDSEVEEQQKNLDQIDLWAMDIQALIKKIRGKI